MNNSCEKDLLGFVLGALDAAEQKEIQQAMDCDPNLEDDLIALKNAIAPLDYLDSGGHPPALARRTCELIAGLLPPASSQSITESSHEAAEPGFLHRLQPAVDWPKLPKSVDFFSVNESAFPALPAFPADFDSLKNSQQDTHSLASGNPGTAADWDKNLQSFGDAKVPGGEDERIDPISAECSPQLAGSGRAPLTPSATITPSATTFTCQLTPESRRHGWYRPTFSLVDLAFAAGLMLILSGILFPAIAYTRYHSRILQCQNNLREIGNSLQAYSHFNQDRFVEIPRSGPLSVVGSFAPILKEAGLVEADSLFACAGVAARHNTPPVLIPTRQTLEMAAGEQLLQLQKSLSGHYGYSMGIASPDGSTSWKNLGRSFVVLVADAPSLNRLDRISLNHHGRGQNCLFEDGRVEFIAGDCLGDDSLFFNDYHQVAPGCRPGDNVIAPSHLSPVFVSQTIAH